MTPAPAAPESRTLARPLRVVVLDHTAELGGAELALVRLCAALGGDVEVRVVLFADGQLKRRLEAVAVAVDVVPLARRVATTGRASAGRLSRATLLGALAVVPFTWRLARRLRALRPDVVYTTSLKADLLGIVPTLVARRPLVWHVHDRIAPDYLPGPLVRIVRWAARTFPVAIVANSRATARTLGVPSAIAYPGFAPEQAAGAAGGWRGAATSGPVVGMVGRVSPTKGQLELVRSLPRILAVHPGARLRIVGEPAFGAEEYAARVRAEAESLGVAGSVEWAGFVADTRAELDALSVCVHAAPVPEPFGQVVVEAMVRGVPVVATRAGGIEEVLEGPDGLLGELVEPGDSRALADAVLCVLADPEAALERALRARDEALERFPVARTAEVVNEVWWNAVEPGRQVERRRLPRSRRA